jgi:steroid 5-alpha reductase family enzyme
MTLLTLAALGWLLAAIAMASLWAWQQLPAGNRRIVVATMASESSVPSARGSYPGGVVRDAGWTALVAGLAVLYANAGAGAWTRRSAIAWMVGSWGARLVVQRLYAPGPSGSPDGSSGAETEPRPSFQAFQGTAASAVFFSLPALIASANPEPTLSTLELVACGIWMAGFAGETTADRQLLRFRSDPANLGLVCRSGLWRYSNDATAVCEAIIWTAYAVFAVASPLGFMAFACPAVMVYGLVNRRAISSQP